MALNFNMDSMGLSQLGGILASIGKIILIVFVVTIIIGGTIAIAYYFFRPMLYRIKVNIYARRHGKYLLFGEDKAKIKKIRSKFWGLIGPVKQTKLQLLQRKIELPTPDFSMLYPNDLAKSPGTLNFLKYGERDYALCSLELDDVKKDKHGNDVGNIRLVPMETDWTNWYLQEGKACEERNSPSDFLSKHQVIIAAGIVCIIMLAGFYTMYVMFKGQFMTFADASGQLATTLKELNQCRI